MADIQLWEESPALQLVAESTRWAPAQPRWHQHAFYELGIVLRGECHWGVRSRMTLLKKGEAILLRPETDHCEQAPPGRSAHLGWIGFHFAGTAPRWTQRPFPLGDDFAEIAACFHAIYREHHRTDPRSRKRVGLALQNLLLLATRQAEADVDVPGKRKKAAPAAHLNPRQIGCVEAAAHYFRQNPEQAMGIAQVAAYHSLCPAHFSTLFRRHHGTTPRAFLGRARLEKAARLLHESDLTIKEIAARCGFVDASHLCKAFKQEHGLTPKAFRGR